jgi:hypothetical protein
MCLLCKEEKEDLEDMFVIEVSSLLSKVILQEQTCRHTFCSNCASDYSNRAKNHRRISQLKCPIEGCSVTLPYNIVKDLLLTEEYDTILQESLQRYFDTLFVMMTS